MHHLTSTARCDGLLQAGGKGSVCSSAVASHLQYLRGASILFALHALLLLQVEVLEGDNQYNAEQHGMQVCSRPGLLPAPLVA